MDANKPIPEEDIRGMLKALATMTAHKTIVERLVIGDNNFSFNENTQYPSLRLDGEKANYYNFFMSHLLPEDEDEEDIRFKAALKVFKKLFTAYANDDYEKIRKYGTLLFDAHITQQTTEFLLYHEVLKSVEAELNSLQYDAEQICKNIDAFKSNLVLRYMLRSYRKTTTEVFLEHNFKFSTLEANIEAIIYGTIMLTEQYLMETQIESLELDGLWDAGGFFCDCWFATTFVTGDEKCQAVRELVLTASEKWPEYAQNGLLILDYAAIIQDRLFSNNSRDPSIDWLKESYRVWNAFAGAALRLGEIFSKYKNHLPFADDEIFPLRESAKTKRPLIITEGKTDWKHIKNALTHFHKQGIYTDIDIEFQEYEDDILMGGVALMQLCKAHAKIHQQRKIICIADLDDPKVVKEMSQPGESFKSWGNNVFSFCIPRPPSREKYDNIFIEFYYSDDEIKQVDMTTGRRLFFTNEVHQIITKSTTTKQTTESWEICPPDASEEYQKKIFDSNCTALRDSTGTEVSHSKAVFAQKIYDHQRGYDEFDLTNFTLILDIVQIILKS